MTITPEPTDSQPDPSPSGPPAGTDAPTPEELALLWGTFIMGRWAENMAADEDQPDDWEQRAAAEAVALFRPALDQMLAEVWDAGAITRARMQPEASVRHLNPYRPQVEVDLSAWTTDGERP